MESSSGSVSSLHRVTLALTGKPGESSRHVLISIDGRSIELTLREWSWILSHPQTYLRDPPPKPSA